MNTCNTCDLFIMKAKANNEEGPQGKNSLNGTTEQFKNHSTLQKKFCE